MSGPLPSGSKAREITVGLIFLTAIIGLYFAKRQGVQTLKSGVINLYQNKIPIYEIMSGASIAIAALFLIIPGFFTDFFGFLLLIPFTRRLFFNLAFKDKTKVNIKSQDKTIDGEIDFFDSVKGESDTLAGLILEIKGNIPENGEILNYKQYSFTVESVDKTRVKRIKVTINE